MTGDVTIVVTITDDGRGSTVVTRELSMYPTVSTDHTGCVDGNFRHEREADRLSNVAREVAAVAAALHLT